MLQLLRRHFFVQNGEKSPMLVFCISELRFLCELSYLLSNVKFRSRGFQRYVGKQIFHVFVKYCSFNTVNILNQYNKLIWCAGIVISFSYQFQATVFHENMEHVLTNISVKFYGPKTIRTKIWAQKSKKPKINILTEKMAPAPMQHPNDHNF